MDFRVDACVLLPSNQRTSLRAHLRYLDLLVNLRAPLQTLSALSSIDTHTEWSVLSLAHSLPDKWLSCPLIVA